MAWLPDRRVRRLEPEVIVCGRRSSYGVEALGVIQRHLRFVLDLAADIDGQGVRPVDLARNVDLGDLGQLTDAKRLVGDLHRARFERRNAEGGALIDVIAAISEMVECNGGRPLRCFA